MGNLQKPFTQGDKVRSKNGKVIVYATVKRCRYIEYLGDKWWIEFEELGGYYNAKNYELVKKF